jgi:signal transduction histidine kinase
MTTEIRPSQLRALLWLLVLVPLIPVGLMLQLTLESARVEQAVALDRLSVAYQRTLESGAAAFARHLGTRRDPPTARDAHQYFRAMLDSGVVVRVVEEGGRVLTGARVPPGPPVAVVGLGASRLPWEVQVFLLDAQAAERGVREQFRGQIGLILGTVVVIVSIAGAAAWTLNRQIELRELRSTAVATVAHELRTPLASLRMLVDTLREGRVREPAAVAEYLELIAQENARLGRLAEDFLTFSRLERGKQPLALEPLSPRAIAEQVVAGLRPRLEAPGCTFSLDVPGDLPPVRADREALAGILTNLLDNALKYTGADKRISLWVRAAREAVVFAVTDNGIGLARAEQRRIFKPFYQVDDRLARSGAGAGLGLAIVARLVAAHGGKIQVDSQPGKGTTFSVRIPTA